jgi:hypothetical protein
VKRDAQPSRELMLLFGTVSVCRQIPFLYPFSKREPSLPALVFGDAPSSYDSLCSMS